MTTKLSQEDRERLTAKVALYEALGFPVLAPVITQIRARLMADQARREATSRK